MDINVCQNSLITKITELLSLVFAIGNFIIKIKGLGSVSLEKTKKRYEIFEKILGEKNKILSYTYLKDYIGVSITDAMCEFILNSTKFYKIVTEYKNVYPYIEPNPVNGKIIYKEGKKPTIIPSVILYFLFLMPALLVLIFLNILMQQYPAYLILATIITIPFTIIAIFIWGNKVGDISQANRLMKTLKEEESEKGSLPLV
jgi:hypothetical protein